MGMHTSDGSEIWQLSSKILRRAFSSTDVSQVSDRETKIFCIQVLIIKVEICTNPIRSDNKRLDM